MAQVLEALDANVLAQRSFHFGGGTCLALAHGEYRLSRDLDFIWPGTAGMAASPGDSRDPSETILT
jgi:hypothetical protein